MRELVEAGYEGKRLFAEVRRLTGLDPQNAAILIGLETGRGPFGDTEPPVRWNPALWERIDRLTSKS